MFSLSPMEVHDLLATIEIGWAHLVPAASFTDEAGCLVTFYAGDGRVYRLAWNPANTMTAYHEVVGEDLDTFHAIYGEG